MSMSAACKQQTGERWCLYLSGPATSPPEKRTEVRRFVDIFVHSIYIMDHLFTQYSHVD